MAISQYVYAEDFITCLLFTPIPLRVSAANIATVYNYATAPASSPVHPAHQPLHLLHSKIVLDAFFLHGLLRDKHQDTARLILPHDGPQEHRFDGALRERNEKIRRCGQEMWAHACDDCVKRFTRPDGTLGMQPPCRSFTSLELILPCSLHFRRCTRRRDSRAPLLCCSQLSGTPGEGAGSLLRCAQIANRRVRSRKMWTAHLPWLYDLPRSRPSRLGGQTSPSTEDHEWRLLHYSLRSPPPCY